MRTFILFVGLLVLSLILAAAVTYPAWLLVGTLSVEPVHRVMHRVAMLIAVIGLVLLTRRLGLANRAAMGYGLPWKDFLKQMMLGWVCGLMLMVPLVALLLGLDIRDLKPAFANGLASLILTGIVSGLVIAFIEETFFRGVLFTAVARTSGIAAAIIAPSLLYASLHFLGGRLRIPDDQVSWTHGFAVLGRLFERYSDPLAFVDSFAALVMLGVLLALVRLRTGAIAASIGLHAAGVGVIASLRASTTLDRDTPYAGIVGTYDGVIGWAALVWFALIVLVLAFAGRSRATRG